MRKIATWFMLLNKRLYKKITFVSILLLIPVFVIAFQLVAQQPSGVVNVVLSCEDSEDLMYREIVEDLKENTKIISFLEATPENAVSQVKAGKADAAWIFPKDLKSSVQRYIMGDSEAEGFVRAVEREQTVVLGLARERLSAVLFNHSVQQTYLHYIRLSVVRASRYTDEELLRYQENADITGKLFEYYDIQGNKKTETANYLTAPLRGLLAVVTAIGCIVTAMYYEKDQENGIFSLLPERYVPLGEFGYQLVSALNLTLVVLVSLLLTGLSVNIFTELLLLLLYSIACGLFGMLLRSLFGGGRWLAVWLPVISLLMLVICPVFFDLSVIQKLQMVFPPTYYINGAFNYRYLVYLVGYIAVLFVLCATIRMGKKLICRKNIKA